MPKNLFKNTAWYYARYRPGYSDKFFKQIAKEFNLDGTGRLLDLGCGSGQLAIPFADHFEEVVAMDPQREMLKEGKRLAQRAHSKNIVWKQGSSEDLRVDMGKFRLVVIGRAFHWMNQKKTLAMLYNMVEPDGGIVIIGERIKDSIWQPESRWKKAVKATIQKYLGEKRRAGDGHYTTIVAGKKFADFIRESPFKKPGGFYEENAKKIWNVRDVIGYLYSTSFSSKALLGKNTPAFEKDLKKALLKANPSGKFIQKTHWGAVIAKRK
jgi:ubiquinone/menaquinone biosynthesis C-methylase UbiE